MTLRVAQFFLKIAHLSFSMGPRGPCAYGLRPRLWLLFKCDLAFLGWHQLFLKSSCKFNWTFQSTVIPKVFLFFLKQIGTFSPIRDTFNTMHKINYNWLVQKNLSKKNLSSIQITIDFYLPLNPDQTAPLQHWEGCWPRFPHSHESQYPQISVFDPTWDTASAPTLPSVHSVCRKPLGRRHLTMKRKTNIA